MDMPRAQSRACLDRTMTNTRTIDGVEMTDPTYVTEEIKKNPVWDLAFVLSEIQNDNAPIGWSKYIFVAECLLAHYEITVLEGHK